MGKRRRGPYADVTAHLDAIRLAGAAKAAWHPDGTLASVEFAPVPVSAAPFVDRKGRPIDFDEGAPALARDPDEPDPRDDEPADRDIERANFTRPAAS